MPVYDFDGYEDYDVKADLLREHVRTIEGGSGSITIDTNGRHGGKRLKIANSFTNSCWAVVRPLPTPVSTIAFGQYVELSALHGTSWLYDLRGVASSQLLIGVHSDGSIGVYRSAQGGSDYSTNVVRSDCHSCGRGWQYGLD